MVKRLLLFLVLCPVIALAQPFSSGLAMRSVKIDISTAATTTVVAAVANQTVNVYGMEFFCSGANGVIIGDTASNVLVPTMTFTASQGVIRDLRSQPWFTGAKAKGITIITSAAQQCSGIMYYTQG